MYEQSGVINIYRDSGNQFEILSAEIDTDHMKTETKAPRGRPL